MTAVFPYFGLFLIACAAAYGLVQCIGGAKGGHDAGGHGHGSHGGHH